MLTSNDLKDRHRAVVNAVASQRLEGLEPDARTIADLQRAAGGTLSVLDVIHTLRARVAAGEFRSSSLYGVGAPSAVGRALGYGTSSSISR